MRPNLKRQLAKLAEVVNIVTIEFPFCNLQFTAIRGHGSRTLQPWTSDRVGNKAPAEFAVAAPGEYTELV